MPDPTNVKELFCQMPYPLPECYACRNAGSRKFLLNDPERKTTPDGCDCLVAYSCPEHIPVAFIGGKVLINA